MDWPNKLVNGIMTTHLTVSEKLREVDSLLVALTSGLNEFDINQQTTPDRWFSSRKSQGVNTDILLRLLADSYKIKIVTTKECVKGTFIGDGFYCSETKIYYRNSVSKSHFEATSNLGFLIYTPALKRKPNNLAIASLRLRKVFIRDKWAKQGVVSVKLRKGFAFSDYVQKEQFLEKVSIDVDYWVIPTIEASDLDEGLISYIWNKASLEMIGQIEKGTSQKLYIVSGDYGPNSIGLFERNAKKSSRLFASTIDDGKLTADIILVDENDILNIERRERIQTILRTGLKYVVFFSSAREIIALYAQLRSFLDVSNIALQLGGHSIRVPMPGLCNQCSTLGPINLIRKMLLELNMEERHYHIRGDGCDKCVDGVYGIHLLDETTCQSEGMSLAIMKAAEDIGGKGGDFGILKEMHNSDISTVYKSLESAASNGLVDVRDAKAVLV